MKSPIRSLILVVFIVSFLLPTFPLSAQVQTCPAIPTGPIIGEPIGLAPGYQLMRVDHNVPLYGAPNLASIMSNPALVITPADGQFPVRPVYSSFNGYSYAFWWIVGGRCSGFFVETAQTIFP